MNEDDAVDEAQKLNENTSSTETTGAKWFVIFFLLVIPALSVTLLAAIIWSLWKALFRG